MAQVQVARTAGPARLGSVLWAEDCLEDQVLIRAAFDDLPAAPRLAFANDGVHLLAQLAEARPTLVVLDLRMPRLGGLETLRRIRADARLADLKVCVFSAGNQPNEIEACQALGALEVAHKPVDFRNFAATVHRLVARAAPS